MPEQSALRDTGPPEVGSTSESEEMYLITVARAVEEGTPEPVPVGVIAEALAHSPTSVNEKIRKLADRNLLAYEPYHGVRLTRDGRIVAARVLRTRRLWATFLANHLGFSPGEADERACRLEHMTAPDAAERLAVFLGEPEADPSGRPIPNTAGSYRPQPVTTSLVHVAAGDIAEVVSIEGSDRVRPFLEAEGITIGARIVVLGAGGSGLLVKAEAVVHLSRELAATIRVRTEEPSARSTSEGPSC